MVYTKVNQNDGRSNPPRSKCGNFLHFLYNSDEGTILGRTCKSWGLIIVFYIIYYLLLSGFVVGMLSVFLFKFIDPQMPMQTGTNSLLKFQLGVNVKPRMVSVYSGNSVNGSKGHKLYSNVVEEFFKKSFLPKNYQKRGDVCNNTTPADLTRFCIFDKSSLGPCADPIKEMENETLCIFVRPNHIYGWLPDIENKTLSNDILVECWGQNPGDIYAFGQPEYYPSLVSGNKKYGKISNLHFPYTNQVNYSTPMVGVRLAQMKKNLIVLIQCDFFNIKNKYKPVKLEVMIRTTDV